MFICEKYKKGGTMKKIRKRNIVLILMLEAIKGYF